MKKLLLLLPLIATLFLISCEKESNSEIFLVSENMEQADLSARSSNKRDVCHNGNIINININAIAAHQAHGDAVDMDGDGFFDMENDCGMPVDCDDTVYDPTNSCGCLEGEIEIDFNGPLFVAPENEPGLYTWQAAKAACASKSTVDGCDWVLPSTDELLAMYLASSEIGLVAQSFYWSSFESADPTFAGALFVFNLTGARVITFQEKTSEFGCRCVRR